VSTFTPEETAACQHLVALALAEDLGTVGDLTSEATIPADLEGRAVFVARTAGVLAGLPAVGLVCSTVDPALQLALQTQDAAALRPGQPLATLRGRMRSILTAERTALNFLQRLSGVASLTRRHVDAIAGLKCQILDTRKTTPGWRLLEKYAVRCGGGHNHRLGLYDGVLIKDNHLAALGGGPAAIRRALQLCRTEVDHHVTVEVEVDSLEQLLAALPCLPDIILLDNMSLDQMRQAVQLRNQTAQGVQLEASGGVTLDTVRAVAETGVDRISIGALTHSAPALDIALDYF
jgi:nicotinate-nucleotide pyrophosphorylase (carboxylating)